MKTGFGYARQTLLWAVLAMAACVMPGQARAQTNLAAGRAATASGQADVYGPSNLTDSNQGSYWESTNNAFPQWAQVDLGSTATVTSVVLKLPATWGDRTQTLAVQGSTDGSTFSTLVASTTYSFKSSSSNVVTINVSSASARYVRVTVTANSGWPAGQLSELEVYGTAGSTGGGTGGGTTPPPSNPTPSGPYVRIKSATNGQYLYGANGRATFGTPTDATDGRFYWVIEDYNAHKRFRNALSGFFMNINNQLGYVEVTSIYDSWASPQWTLETGTSSSNYVIRNAWATTNIMHAQDNLGYAQYGNLANTAASAQWQFESYTTIPQAPSQPDPAPGVGSNVFEAENAFLSNGAQKATTQSGYSGTGYVTNFAAVNARVIFAVNVPSAGNYSVKTTYATPSGSAKTLSVYINGLKSSQFLFTASTAWTARTDSLALRQGMNTVWFQYDSGDTGAINLDSIQVVGATNLTRGATLPFTSYEAEGGSTNGTLVGPDRNVFAQLAEASGRRAVNLTGAGKYVEITLTQPANAIVVRYSIPDAASGGGITAPLGIYINGTKKQDLTLTSKYDYAYGWYTFTNNPSDGRTHHYFDESHLLLGQTYPAGTKIKLQKDASDSVVLTLDLMDGEQVPAAYTQPANFVSITDYGATPNDGTDDYTAITNALTAAKAAGKGVWIPQGTFNVEQARLVAYGVTVRGAGPWYSTLAGSNAGFYYGGSDNTFQNRFFDFAIFGETVLRNDNAPDNAFDDNMGTGSVLQNLWIEHKKCGGWINYPTTEMYVVGTKIRDSYADGLNYAGGTINSWVEQSHLRNTGDDSLASWSSTYKTQVPTQNIKFRFNTVVAPWFANGIALYGGSGGSVTDNIVSDASAGYGGGINVSTNFPMVAFSGTITVAHNTLFRGGGYENDGQDPFGSIWINLRGGDINTPVLITDNSTDASTYSGFEVRGGGKITGLVVDTLKITNAGTYGVELRENPSGSGTFNNVTVTTPAYGGLGTNNATGFTITRGSGDTGW